MISSDNQDVQKLKLIYTLPQKGVENASVRPAFSSLPLSGG